MNDKQLTPEERNIELHLKNIKDKQDQYAQIAGLEARVEERNNLIIKQQSCIAELERENARLSKLVGECEQYFGQTFR